MAYQLSSFFVGLLFAVGLSVSGMVDPLKIIGFLNVFGRWNPALVWAMVGAISSFAAVCFFAKKLKKPLFAASWDRIPPKASSSSWQVKFGNVLFGIGLGLSGYCPGAAIASLPSGQNSALVFCLALLTGFMLWELHKSFSKTKSST